MCVCVCVWNTMPPVQQSLKKTIFSMKVKVKSQGHWPRCHLKTHYYFEYACQIWSLYLLQFKRYSECWSWQQTNRQQRDRQTNKQTDRTKTICPRSFDKISRKDTQHHQYYWKKNQQQATMGVKKELDESRKL